jgi:hypothetical protein
MKKFCKNSYNKIRTYLISRACPNRAALGGETISPVASCGRLPGVLDFALSIASTCDNNPIPKLSS